MLFFLQVLAKKVGIKNSLPILKEIKAGVENWKMYGKELKKFNKK